MSDRSAAHNTAAKAAPIAEGGTGQALLFLVAAAMFMENLDGTIIATALPTMARSFHVSAVDLNLGISAYLLALGTFIPASGWVADRFGTRRVFATAIVLFTLASALCGFSQNLGEFVAVRILQGLAGALMVPVGRLVVLRNTPRDKLMDAMSTLVWPALVAPVLGPPLGGFIAGHASWRWIFYLNLPLGALALLAAWRLVPDIRAEQRLPFDWKGFALCGSGIFALMFGLERLAQRPDPRSIALVIAGLALLWGAVRHFRRARHPMIDLSAWSIRTFRMSMRGGSMFRMAIGSAPFLLPLAFQVGFGFSPQKSGLLMLGVFGANLGMKTVTSALLRRFGFRPVMLVNGLLATVALAACATISADTPLALLIAVLAFGGATRSMQFTTISMICFADVPQPQMAGANGLANTISQLTMGAGIALGAMAIRGGTSIAHAHDLADGAAGFRIAFLLVSLVSLAGLVDALLLPRNAGARLTRPLPA